MSILPVSKRKKGVVLFSCNGFSDEGKARTEVWEWVITNISKPRRNKRQIELGMTLPTVCTAIAKNSLTFKNGEWNKKIINDYADIYKCEWRVDGEMTDGLATTVRQAVLNEIKLTNDFISDLIPGSEDDVEINSEKAVLLALHKRLGKLKGKSAQRLS